MTAIKQCIIVINCNSCYKKKKKIQKFPIKENKQDRVHSSFLTRLHAALTTYLTAMQNRTRCFLFSEDKMRKECQKLVKCEGNGRTEQRKCQKSYLTLSLCLHIPTCSHPISPHMKHSIRCQHFGTVEQFRSDAPLALSLSPALSSSF